LRRDVPPRILSHWYHLLFRMISFVIPAHNEAAGITACIAAIRESMQPGGQPYEIIVVNDASTDNTAALAEDSGARVIHVIHRHIAATRNSGARAALGDYLFFIDADTLINPRYLQSALSGLDKGAAGGGGVPAFDKPLPLWFYLGYPIFLALILILKQPGGSSLFCTRAAYEATGGFDENYYAAEDALMVFALKRQGRFVLASGKVLTSGRKARTYSCWYFIRTLFTVGLKGPKGLQRRQGLDIWYDSKRE
jgi:glycosyltransferase involved in cell wall biosynthesis